MLFVIQVSILLDEARKLEATGTEPEEVHLTHFDVAGLVGTSRESVSRVLKRLEKEGLVGLQRGRISILDRQKLQEIAQG